MGSTTDIKNGVCIEHNNSLWKVVEFQHVKPGKGPAFVRTKIKNLSTGKVVDNTFPSGHRIDIVRVENRRYQYLYNEGDTYHFMNVDDYNQITMEKELIDATQFLKEGQILEVLFDAEKEIPLTCDLPPNVVLEVVKSEPGVKGNTATNATKPVILETGASIFAPLFIEEGDKIKIDTVKGVYLERVK
ncbi:elongation factor P [Ichthyobacterium seriolicida]|uniref:Elongation factor P n=1 Tax=Ichthyobacterium seriolicida TaxID=242600 RepID=A0A1J1E6J4_9FLAO|nr:elongation factor P [Ichthyobacterium seriolicida]BAV94950.1 translation elongation factor P [Ichthyobacterium seriolicida]